MGYSQAVAYAAIALVLGTSACEAGGSSERAENATSEGPTPTVDRVEVASSLDSKGYELGERTRGQVK
jgi:hypothetical protein